MRFDLAFFLKPLLVSITITSILFSCGKAEQTTSTIEDATSNSETTHANSFGFNRHKDYTHLWIVGNAGSSDHFYLVEKNKPIPAEVLGKENIIRVPVETVICTSTTQIPWLDLLESSVALSGFPDPGYVFSEVQRERFRNGSLKDIGGPSGMETEQLVALRPELVLSFSGRREENVESVLRELRIPLIKTREHLEAHPLGRAEWIKFMGLMLNKEQQADSIFRLVQQNYLQLLQSSQSASVRSKVLTGIPYSGTWYLPGRGSYAAQLFQDSGFDYSWEGQGSDPVLPMSLETVFRLGLNADYWIGISNIPSTKNLLSIDPRFSDFKSVSRGALWTYDRRSLPTGGNDYFETAGVRPDLLLNDLITIRTSGDTSRLYFYRRLK